MNFYLVLSVIVALFFGYFFFLQKNKVYPSGPWSLPFLGNLIEFNAIKARPDQELLRIAKKYGEICMLWFGTNPVLIINSPKVAKEMMDKRGAIYSSRPAQNNFRANQWPWRLVTTPTGETFRLLRKIYHNLLGPSQSVHFRKYQDFESKVMMADLLDIPEGFLAGVERFAMSVIFSACYGVRLEKLEHPTMVMFYSIWEEMLKYFQPGSLIIDFFPILQRLPKSMQPWMKLADSLRVGELRLHRAFLHTLKKQVQAGNAPTCFGTMLVQIQKKEDISDERACDILAMLIGAGADTTSSYLQSFFKVMALHPEVSQKAQAVGPHRLPQWEDEPNLPYVRAIIKEVHRWAPIGSLGVPHATTDSDDYEGRHIPKDTIVFPNLTNLSRDSDRYEQADYFLPERFLGDDLDASSSALHPDWRVRDHFHYGFGRRLCQGIFVAEASLYIVVSRLLWGFNITPIEGEELDMDSKIAGLVTKPRPYKVSIKSRSPSHEDVIRKERQTATTDILNFDNVKMTHV
ncbi:cytochrome P450 [Penicillium angulare]|uniref:Cytochrome P450 n=1 Tax=Penicillium angulare TaxID=116970 RepID=A0A9W9K0G4_9EURO|nr:cytochrome P450 [Penicillium angulare]